MDKDLRKILKAAAAQGFEIKHTSDGHPMVYRDGQYVTKIATTPSDRRGQQNAISRLKRYGFIWPKR